MKKLFAVLGFVFLAGCCSDAFAADEFGSRFGDSSPYALGNTVGKATDSATTMGLDDLNTITPTAQQLPPPVEASLESGAETELNAIAPAAGAEIDSEAASDLETEAAPDLPAPSDTPPVAAQPTSEQLPNP